MQIIDDLIKKYPELMTCQVDIEAAYRCLADCFHSGGKLLVCGNGGSAADSLHIVGELMKGFGSKRLLPDAAMDKLRETGIDSNEYLATHLQGALPAISLVNEVSLMTAFSNDVDPQLVFAQQVYGLGQEGDVLWVISTSGNAPNILEAVRVASAFGLCTIGLTGPSGGRLKSVCDITICAPGNDTPAIQERHLPIYHALCLALEETFFVK